VKGRGLAEEGGDAREGGAASGGRANEREWRAGEREGACDAHDVEHGLGVQRAQHPVRGRHALEERLHERTESKK